MRLCRFILFSITALTISTSAASAGPCSSEIGQAQANVDAYLESRAAAGSSAQESVSALMHHQPTRNSIAQAEETLGDLDPSQFKALVQAISRARTSDQAGNIRACQQALAEVNRAIAPFARCGIGICR
jgi:hypothetical protein